MTPNILSYQDDAGMWWVMCACGHRVGGSARPGDKIAMCPNCSFSLKFAGASVHIDKEKILILGNHIIPVVYPEFLPEDGSLSQEGDHPDHAARHEAMRIKGEKTLKAKERRELKKIKGDPK